MKGSVVMNTDDGSPELNFRGTHEFQSVALAAELETTILSARYGGSESPILELDILLEDGRTSSLKVEVLDEVPTISDAGTSYRCHRLPYGATEVYGVTLLIPPEPEGKKALVSVSY